MSHHTVTSSSAAWRARLEPHSCLLWKEPTERVLWNALWAADSGNRTHTTRRPTLGYSGAPLAPRGWNIRGGERHCMHQQRIQFCSLLTRIRDWNPCPTRNPAGLTRNLVRDAEHGTWSGIGTGSEEGQTHPYSGPYEPNGGVKGYVSNEKH